MHSYFYSALLYVNSKDIVVEFLLPRGERMYSCGVYMYIQVYMQVHDEASGQVCIFPDTLHLSLNLGLVILLGTQIRALIVSSPHHSTVVIDANCCAQLPVWVLALSCECGMHFTNSHLLSTLVRFQ